jgi:hypothetical protein
MKSYRLHVLLIVLLFAIAGFAQEPNRSLSMSSYIAELDRLSAAIENTPADLQSIVNIVRQMPSEWSVRIEDRSFYVRSGWIQEGLKELLEKNSDDTRRLALARIAVLKTEVQVFQQPRQDRTPFKNAMDGILARPEFREVHSPSWIDALTKKLVALIYGLLGRIAGNSAFPTISKIIIWMLICVAVLAMAMWILKTIRKNARLDLSMLQSTPVSAKPWDAWMTEAHEAAAKGLWRDAVHLSYWAGISFLESRGLWRPDAARTPREYLRLIQSSSEFSSSLSFLTRQLEAVWYGYAQAGPDSFAEALRHLESMGCRSN